MTLRDQIRRLRLYYKAMPHVFSVLENPLAAFFLPLTGRSASFFAKGDVAVAVPAGDWDLLPNMCRLAEIGASCRIEGDCKRIEIDDLIFYTPKEARVEGDFFREIFREDVYRLKGKDLRGKTAVDIGAYIGDSSLILAQQGAQVFALEPSRANGVLLQRNLAANRLAGEVKFFNVGLSGSDGEVSGDNDTLTFVTAMDFIVAELPQSIDLLKMDCEGCEYVLLADPRFLDHLSPAAVSMEYHKGAASLAAMFRERGYNVETVACDESVGYLYAVRRT